LDRGAVGGGSRIQESVVWVRGVFRGRITPFWEGAGARKDAPRSVSIKLGKKETAGRSSPVAAGPGRLLSRRPEYQNIGGPRGTGRAAVLARQGQVTRGNRQPDRPRPMWNFQGPTVRDLLNRGQPGEREKRKSGQAAAAGFGLWTVIVCGADAPEKGQMACWARRGVAQLAKRGPGSTRSKRIVNGSRVAPGARARGLLGHRY